MNSIITSIDRSRFWTQAIPLMITVLVLAVLAATLHAVLFLLNQFPIAEPISMHIRWYDVAVGMTIYLKTSIDFAIFMGRLMAEYHGWRSRVAIEVGTALGNALGTLIIICIWVMFKEVHILLALMVLLAAFVLFELAYGSLDHFSSWKQAGKPKRMAYAALNRFLTAVGRVINPVLSKVMPDLREKMKGQTNLSWKKLLSFSMSVPFILGLDDFAGYVPLFSVVNVYGFAFGVLAAHTVLNISLFISPSRTIKLVKNEYISFLGTIAFIALGIFGVWESMRVITETLLGH